MFSKEQLENVCEIIVYELRKRGGTHMLHGLESNVIKHFTKVYQCRQLFYDGITILEENGVVAVNGHCIVIK